MTLDVLNRLEKLNKESNWISTNKLVHEMMEFGEPNDIINNLIDGKIVERIVEEKSDVCSFNTLKLSRLLKLKKLD